VVKELLELTEALLRTPQRQAERIEQLRNEIAILKGERRKAQADVQGERDGA